MLGRMPGVLAPGKTEHSEAAGLTRKAAPPLSKGQMMTHRNQDYQSATHRLLARKARIGWPLVACSAAAFVAGVLSAQLNASDTTPAPQAAPSQSWQLVQHYRGDTFILDHGMTHDDCDDATPRNQAAKHLRFSCELEG